MNNSYEIFGFTPEFDRMVSLPTFATKIQRKNSRSETPLKKSVARFQDTGLSPIFKGKEWAPNQNQTSGKLRK